MAIGKGMGNGFPVTAIAVKEEHAAALAASFPSTSYGGNPMACAAVSAVISVMQEEDLVADCAETSVSTPSSGCGRWRSGIRSSERSVAAVRSSPSSSSRTRRREEPFVEAGNQVYQAAFGRGLAWATAGHILRITPPIVMSTELMGKGLDLIEESIAEVEQRFGY